MLLIVLITVALLCFHKDNDTNMSVTCARVCVEMHVNSRADVKYTPGTNIGLSDERQMKGKESSCEVCV